MKAYRFQVVLEWKHEVRRTIELRGDQSLHDMHRAIQEAFDWDDDHLYAFYLSGRNWDKKSLYEPARNPARRACRGTTMTCGA